MAMSELNRALQVVYGLGADDKTLRKLATPAAYKIHSYLLRVSWGSRSLVTYTTLDELSELLNLPYNTCYRVVQSLDQEGFLESRRGKPLCKGKGQRSGGKGRNAWRVKL